MFAKILWECLYIYIYVRTSMVYYNNVYVRYKKSATYSPHFIPSLSTNYFRFMSKIYVVLNRRTSLKYRSCGRLLLRRYNVTPYFVFVIVILLVKLKYLHLSFKLVHLCIITQYASISINIFLLPVYVQVEIYVFAHV